MAQLERTPNVSLGKIGDIVSISPSSREPLGRSGSDLAAARAEIQTAGVNAQKADLERQNADVLFQESDQLLKPLEKLAATRELIQSNTILSEAQLAMRAHVSALKSGNTPYLQWVGAAQKQFGDVAASARKSAEAISPASAEFVTQHLQQEQLRLVGQVQGEVLGREANDQLSKIESFRDNARETFFQLPPGQERVDLLERFVAVHRGSAQLGLISATDAQKEIHEFTKFIRTNNITDLATQDVMSAITAAEQETSFTPQERQTVIDRAIEVAGTANRLNHLTEAAKKAQLKTDQDTLAIQQFTVASDLNTPIADLQALVTANLQNVRLGKLRDEDARRVVEKLRDREELYRKGVTPVDDPSRVAVWHSQIHEHPELVDPRQILSDPSVQVAASSLIEKYYEVQDKRHFVHNHTYQGLVKELRDVEPTNVIWDMSKSGPGAVASEIQRAINEMDRLLSTAAGPKGIFPAATADRDIRAIAEPYVAAAKARLKEKKPVLGPGASWNELQGLPVSP